MEKDELIETQRALAQNWALVPADENAENWSKEELLRALASRVRHYLENDFHKLMNALYRLDISEEKYHAAMALPTLDQSAAALAESILEREIQKMRTRKNYGSQGTKKLREND